MRITFVLPVIDLLGGVKVVFEYANRLQSKGHEVRIVYPIFPIYQKKKWYSIYNISKKAVKTLRNLKKGNTVDWFDLKTPLMRKPTLNEIFIPDGDIIVATSWETAYFVSKYGKNKGEKFYLIQHYETWSGDKDKVDLSYKLGFHNIVISTWLKNILEKKLLVKTEALILNGINLDQFCPETVPKIHTELRILMPYRSNEWKGVRDGLKAFEIVKEKYADARLVMFGTQEKKGIPENIEYHTNITTNELVKLYRSCDIFMYPSHCEGFGLPPMEAMACGCAVVTTNVGAVPDYTIPGKTALVSPPKDPESLAKNIIRLIENENERKLIAQDGYDYIKQFTWEKSTDELEKVFMKYV